MPVAKKPQNLTDSFVSYFREENTRYACIFCLKNRRDFSWIGHLQDLFQALQKDADLGVRGKRSQNLVCHAIIA